MLCLKLILVLSISISANVLAETIKLGGIFDLSSGAGSAWGGSERNGFNLAIKDFNQQHPGHLAQGIVEDSSYKNIDSVTAFRKLVAVDKVSAILGPTWESFFAVEPLCHSNKITCISVSANLGRFENDLSTYSLTTWLDERDYINVLRDRMLDFKLSQIAVVSALTPYHEAALSHFIKTFQHKPVFQESLDPDSLDFRTLITKIPKAVDGVMLLLPGDNAIPIFLKQWVELRKDKPIIFTDDYILYSTQKNSVISTGLPIWHSSPDFSNPKMQEFIDRYRQEFGEEPASPGAAVTYDSTRMVLDCLLRSPVEQLTSCLRSMQDYQGYSGNLSFSGRRFVKRNVMRVSKLE